MSKLPRKLSEIEDKQPKQKKKAPTTKKVPKEKITTENESGEKTNDRTITKITTQKRKGRYNIFLDDKYAFPVDESVLIKYMLQKGMEVSKELEDKITNDDMVQKAFQRALAYLSHNLRSEKQVRDDLIDKEYEDQADEVIEKLKDMNLLNDLELAKSYVRTSANINRKGPRNIQNELFRKYGVDENMQLDALEEYPADQQLENAIHLGNKKIKQSKKNSSFDTKNKVKQFLMQKGYDKDIIDEAIDLLDYEKSEDEEWEALLKQANKAWRRYSRKFQGNERNQKVKTNLYQKGFPGNLINQYIEEMEEMEESDD